MPVVGGRLPTPILLDALTEAAGVGECEEQPGRRESRAVSVFPFDSPGPNVVAGEVLLISWGQVSAADGHQQGRASYWRVSFVNRYGQPEDRKLEGVAHPPCERPGLLVLFLVP